jgi:ferredoxin
MASGGNYWPKPKLSYRLYIQVVRSIQEDVQLKILVNNSRCTGHARCAAVAPELYELDANGYIAFTGKTVPPELEEQAVKGARACPERALKVIRE